MDFGTLSRPATIVPLAMPISPMRETSLFFFSSRRRHTISDRDWSSDVCSSDLAEADYRRAPPDSPPRRAESSQHHTTNVVWSKPGGAENHVVVTARNVIAAAAEIGRASCRERV